MGLTCVAYGDMSTATGDATHALGLGSVSMGYKSYAVGELTLAAGNHAFANYDGSFVWADDNVTNAVFQDTAPDQFLIRASGGVGIGTQTPPPGGLNVASGGLAVSGTSSPYYSGAVGVFIENETTFGAIYGFNYTTTAPLPLCLNTPGGNVGIGTTTPTHTLEVAGSCEATVFVTASDRNAKENFQPVSPKEILNKVTSLHVSRWNFKKDNSGDHIGPMAQDFYAAFNVGQDDRHIATVDEDGVALAAIQGLNQKLEADVKVKDAEIATLNERLAGLEALVKELAAKNSSPILSH
jgi:trimeric autotransporter adhesin